MDHKRTNARVHPKYELLFRSGFTEVIAMVCDYSEYVRTCRIGRLISW